MKKIPFCICENKGADQLRSKVTVQLISAFFFCFKDSTLPLLSKSKRARVDKTVFWPQIS